jgi:addiction module RelB/DinJ family antitoxin
MQTSTIHVRVSGKLKKAAQRVAEINGLDLSTCIRMFLQHMEVRGHIPLSLLSVNGLSPEEEQEILQRAQESTEAIDDIEAFLRSAR